jgi:hypothetical protein
MTDQHFVTFPDEQAARLAKITPHQLDYWARTGLVVPSIERRLSPRNRVRLYSFGDVVDLITVSGTPRRAGAPGAPRSGPPSRSPVYPTTQQSVL